MGDARRAFPYLGKGVGDAGCRVASCEGRLSVLVRKMWLMRGAPAVLVKGGRCEARLPYYMYMYMYE